MSNRYQVLGYANRKAYVTAMAKEHGVPLRVAFETANALGAYDDFDGLISEFQQYADFNFTADTKEVK